MFTQAVDRVEEGVKDKVIDAKSGEPVQHPFRVLQGHGPAKTMKAFNHGTLRTQLVRQGAGNLRIGAQIISVLIQYPLQRTPHFFMGTIATGNMAVELRRHAHGWYFSCILQMMLLTPLAHLLVIVLSEQLMETLKE